ncbi:MAG: hypothetical protein ACJ8MR_00330, partial [Povalibacter sp.]
IQGTRIVLTDELLVELKKPRLHDVVTADDIAPNNAVFVLSHLVYHLKNPVDPRKFSTPAPYRDAAMKIESAAFIDAWNAMLLVAEKSTGNKALSPGQQGQFLMNTRYRFAFLQALEEADAPLQFSSTGFIEPDEINLQAIINALSHSSIADLE